MPKITLQLKNILAVAFSALIGLFSGVTVNRWDAKPKSWIFPACVVLILLLAQIRLVVLNESKEEEELALQREGRLKAERRNQELNERMANELSKALEERRYKDYAWLKREYRG